MLGLILAGRGVGRYRSDIQPTANKQRRRPMPRGGGFVRRRCRVWPLPKPRGRPASTGCNPGSVLPETGSSDQTLPSAKAYCDERHSGGRLACQIGRCGPCHALQRVTIGCSMDARIWVAEGYRRPNNRTLRPILRRFFIGGGNCFLGAIFGHRRRGAGIAVPRID